MAFPIPPAHLPGAKPSYETSKRALVRRLHNRRVSMALLANGNYYVHFAVALQPGEAAALRAEGHTDSVRDYILRDRVRYWVLVLQSETVEVLMGGWNDLQARQQQRKGCKRV
ncbi:hypothetical protein [Hymenobacter aerophilus]|uniref:hypothetical protein n=1 Tax=Hymenobacter aerophilus TaxID=119644 RepID=UPI00037C9520|nr:hypothetical protein [Hymenobacter aerophilus]